MLYQTENRHGGDIYGDIALDFSANVSPLGTPRSVTDAIERALPELYRYPDPYCRTLVQTISEYEGVPKNFVLCGNGASELIYAYCGAARPKPRDGARTDVFGVFACLAADRLRGRALCAQARGKL